MLKHFAGTCLCLVALLAGCADSGGKMGGTLQTEYSDSADVNQILAEKVTPLPGSSEFGVRDSLIGSRADVEASLSTLAVVKGNIPLPAAQRYLERIRDKLLAKWHHPRPFGRPPIRIIGTMNYNAEAVSFDSIEVSVGVLMNAASEDEVAFVIGHELGHMLLLHQIRRQNQLQVTENTVDRLGILAMGAAIASNSRKVGGVAVIKDSVKLTAVASTFAGQTAVAEMVTAVIDPGWSSRQEEQADLIGVDLMTEAGYNPWNVSNAIDRVQADEEAAKRRIAEMEAISPQISLSSITTGSLVNIFDDAINGMKGQLRRLRVNHPDTKDRQNSISDYRKHIFAHGEQDRTESVSELKALQRHREMIDAREAIETLIGADAALGKHDLEASIALAVRAHRLAPTWWAPNYIAGLAQLEVGETRSALSFLAAAASADGSPYEAFERSAFELIKNRNAGGAIATLNAAARRFGGMDITLPDRIVVYRYAKNTGGAKQALDFCNKSENPRLRESCGRAASRDVERI